MMLALNDSRWSHWWVSVYTVYTDLDYASGWGTAWGSSRSSKDFLFLQKALDWIRLRISPPVLLFVLNSCIFIIKLDTLLPFTWPGPIFAAVSIAAVAVCCGHCEWQIWVKQPNPIRFSRMIFGSLFATGTVLQLLASISLLLRHLDLTVQSSNFKLKCFLKWP